MFSLLKDRLDSWYNTVSGLGTSTFDKLRNHVPTPPIILSTATLETLYHGDFLAARIVEAPIEEGLRNGLELEGDEEGLIEEELDRWEVLSKVAEAAIWGRLWGGGAILLGVRGADQTEPLRTPIAPGSLAYIKVLERKDFSPLTYYQDPDHPKWGEVELFSVSKSINEGQVIMGNVHESRMIRFGGARTTDNYRSMNGGWDLSILQRPYEILRANDLSFKALGHLIEDASQSVYSIKGLSEIIAGGHQQQLQNRMLAVDMARSVARAILVDADLEDFKQVGAANLGGIAPAIDKVVERVAAAAQMPVTVLMGRSPAGMNATGESDLENWHKILELHRKKLEPAIYMIAGLVAENAGLNAEEISIKWPSLWSTTPDKEAAIRKTVADTDKIYIDSGVLTPEEVTLARWGKGYYSTETASAVDLESREPISQEEVEAALAPPTEEEEEESDAEETQEDTQET